MTVHCISSAKLAHFLKREPRSITGNIDLDLNRIFRELLGRANEFLPSEAGTIYLDDPLSQGDDESRRFLVIIASFGAAAEKLVEQRLLASTGIIGEVYRTGLPYSSSARSTARECPTPLPTHTRTRSTGAGQGCAWALQWSP